MDTIDRLIEAAELSNALGDAKGVEAALHLLRDYLRRVQMCVNEVQDFTRQLDEGQYRLMATVRSPFDPETVARHLKHAVAILTDERG